MIKILLCIYLCVNQVIWGNVHIPKVFIYLHFEANCTPCLLNY